MKRTRIPLGLALAMMLAVGSYLIPAAPAATVGPVTDPIGVLKVNKGAPIVIAWWLVVSGPDASLGIDTRTGAEIAVEEKKTLVGHPIRLIGEDSGCTPEGGTTAATKIAANKSVLVAIGSTCSSEAIPGAPILWKAGIATVSPSNTAPSLTASNRAKSFDGYMRTAHNDKVQGAALARFARNNLKISRAATIHDGSPYSEELADVFGDTFKKLGGTLTAREAIGPTDTDMRPVLTKIAATRPEALFYPVFIAGGGFITRQSKEVAGMEKVTLLGADGLFSPDFMKAAGESAKGMYHSSPDLTAFAATYKGLREKYVKKIGSQPLAPFHAHAYDAAYIIFAAVEKVAKKDAQGNTYIGRKALRDALFATKNFKGVTGTLNCNQFGDCANPVIAIYQTLDTDPAKWNPPTNPKKVS